MGQMDGRIAVVSGLDSPLKTDLAERLRDEGANVLVVEPGAETVRNAGSAYGKIDALVNVLKGSGGDAAFTDQDSSVMEKMLSQVGDFATGMRAAWPFLRRGTNARVVNVCAPQGSTTYYRFAEAVTADFALQGLTRAVGAEWAQSNVLVNCIVPGLVDLPELAEYRARQPALFAKRLANTALQRLGDARRDIGGAMMFLLADEACFIVGHPVYADGGQHLSTAVFDPGGPAAAARV